jgi:hypothetical protein
VYKFFFYWTVLVLIVEDVDSICRLWVVTVNVALCALCDVALGSG